MAKVTSKLQVTIPRAIADRYGIAPGDEIEWVPAGEVLRVVPPRGVRRPITVAERLRLFDDSRARQARRQARSGTKPSGGARGWTREELYRRGRSG